MPLLRVVGFGTVHYLFRRPNQPILDVCERKYLRRGLRGSLLLADGNNYRAQLGRYFGDCPAAGAAAETIPFTAAGLVTVVQAYNETCTPGRQQAHSWLAQASPRRRVALQGGVLTGMRYSRYESSTPFTGLGFDSQLHPFAGLYADLFQPNRTTAIYGELTMSAFRSRVTNYYGPSFNYRALLGTARLGVRLFFPRPHEQYWLVGFGLELNKVINPTITTQLSPLASFPNKELRYASPTLFPNVGLGWRYRHITLSLDGQLYIDHTDNLGFEAAFFSENIATRLSVGYRLGHNPDLVAKRP